MADEKKSFDNKPVADKKPVGWNLDPIEGGLVLLLILAIVTTFLPTIWNFVTQSELSFFGVEFSSVYNFFVRHLFFFKFLGFVIAAVAAFGTVVFTKKGDAIWRAEKARLNPIQVPTGKESLQMRNPTAEKWQMILEKSNSTNETDWRLAIIEADIILDSLLGKLNLPGASIGDKLKSVEPSDFLTLDQAWEAHKARNNIAHQGSDFLLNQREVRRVITLYEEVFNEFHII